MPPVVQDRAVLLGQQGEGLSCGVEAGHVCAIVRSESKRRIIQSRLARDGTKQRRLESGHRTLNSPTGDVFLNFACASGLSVGWLNPWTADEQPARLNCSEKCRPSTVERVYSSRKSPRPLESQPPWAGSSTKWIVGHREPWSRQLQRCLWYVENIAPRVEESLFYSSRKMRLRQRGLLADSHLERAAPLNESGHTQPWIRQPKRFLIYRWISPCTRRARCDFAVIARPPPGSFRNRAARLGPGQETKLG